MSCSKDTAPKYKKRPSPPIPAKTCDIGTIKTGNDGKQYQIVAFNSKSGITHRWVSCEKANTNCGNKKSTKKTKSSPKKAKSSPKKAKHKSKPEKKIHKYNVSSKIKFVRVLEDNSVPNPSPQELYTYMSSNNRYIRLVEDLAAYQMIYDKISDIKITSNLSLLFTLIINKDSDLNEYRNKPYYFNKDIPTAGQVKKELGENVSSFNDGCYGGNILNECHYPTPDKKDLLGEITLSDIKVSKRQAKAKKTPAKKCPIGKVLSAKGRCIIDRSKKIKNKK